MRDAFFAELDAWFAPDERVVFLTGDLGYKLFDPLRARAPERVVNFGIREGAMVGFAAGLARTGLRPVVYSIVPFLTLRALEQIKLDVCYNRCNVLLVGVGGGFAYGPNGPTHHGVDDWAVLGGLPGLRVWAPADPGEVRAFVRRAADGDGPAYLRLGRNGEAPLRAAVPDAGAPWVAYPGGDGTIFTSGVILHEVLAARDLLAADGIRPRVVHLPELRPFPRAFVLQAVSDGAPVLTVEEHVASGGLGQAVALCLAEAGMGNPFRALCVPTAFPGCCMSRAASLAWAGIDAVSLAEAYRALEARARPARRAVPSTP